MQFGMQQPGFGQSPFGQQFSQFGSPQQQMNVLSQSDQEQTNSQNQNSQPLVTTVPTVEELNQIPLDDNTLVGDVKWADLKAEAMDDAYLSSP